MRLSGLLSTCIAVMLAVPVYAQSYPDKPVQLIVPFSAGGAVDYVARVLAQGLSGKLNQPVVVENRGGASGNIGTRGVAIAKPDGYTLLMSPVTSTAITILTQQGKPGYSYADDFVPVAFVGQVPTVLVVGASTPIKTVQEFVTASAGEKPLSFGSSGVGTTEHLAMELFMQASKAKLIHIPYQGAAPAMADIAGGHVTAMIATVPTAIPMITGGSVRPLMVASKTPLAKLPGVPTAVEAGYPNVDVSSMYAILAPKGLAPEILKKLNGDLGEITSDSAYKTSMAERGIEAVSSSVEQSQVLFTGELSKWTSVVSGLKSEGK